MNALLTACLLAVNVTTQFGGIGGGGIAAPPPKRVETSERPRTRLYVRTIPPGAQVTFDGKTLGPSDGLFLVPAGVGKLSIKFDGEKPRIEQIDVPEGRVTRIEVDMQAEGAAAGAALPALPGASMGMSRVAPNGLGLGSGLSSPAPFFGSGGGMAGPSVKLALFRVKQAKPAPTLTSQPLDVALEKPCDVDFVDAPLKDVCDFLQTQSTVDIRLDPSGLKEDNISPDTPVTLSLKAIRLSSALDILSESVRLAWTIRDDSIVLTSQGQAKNQRINRVYDVSDLTSDFEGLIDLIQFGPSRDHWTSQGGEGRIEVDPADSEESLVVAQSEANHRRIDELLRLLRQVRAGGVGGSSALAERGYWSHAEAAAKARAALDAPVQADFVDAPLQDVVSFLASQAAGSIMINKASLEDNGIPSDSTVTLSSKNKRLESVLRAVLEPLELTFEVESDVLQIVAAGQTRRSLAVYPVSELVAPGREVSQIAHLVEQTTATGSWADTDGGEGDIFAVDGTIQCLVVYQTTAAHREITSLLSRLRKPKK